MNNILRNNTATPRCRGCDKVATQNKLGPVIDFLASNEAPSPEVFTRGQACTLPLFAVPFDIRLRRLRCHL